MNLNFIKNTNLFSLFMFSLTSLPISFASCSVNNSLDNEASNSFINLSELAITRSSITSKLYSKNNGYLFLQNGHNLSMFTMFIDSYFSMPVGYGFGGSLYADLAYRHLVNRSLYINGGLGFKVGKLSTESYKSLKDSLSYGFGLFGGFKHDSGIEASLQGDLPIFNSNGKTGMILNIKYDLFSVELGLNNLYSSINTDWKTVFIGGRFNIIELISNLEIIDKGLSRFIDLQILIGYDLKRGVIHRREFSIGLFNKYTSVLEEFNNVGKILKNNTIEYGWNKILVEGLTEHNELPQDIKKNVESFTEYKKLVIDTDHLPKNIQKEIARYHKKLRKYKELFRSGKPITIIIQEDIKEKLQEFQEKIDELKKQCSEEAKELLSEKSKKKYNEFEEYIAQILQTKEIVESRLISELFSILKEDFIEGIKQEIESMHKKLELSGDVYQFLTESVNFINKLKLELEKEILKRNVQIFHKFNKIVSYEEKKLIKKLLKSLKNQETSNEIFKETEKEQLLQIVKKQLHILKTNESFEILSSLNLFSCLITDKIIEESYKIIINHKKITQEYKKIFEIYTNNLNKINIESHILTDYIILQNHKKLLFS